MAGWDLAYTWRRPLVLLARGLCACSLALFYLFMSLVLCSGNRTALAAPTPHLQESLRKESTEPSPSQIVKRKPSAIPEAIVGFDTPLNLHHHSNFSGGRASVTNPREGASPLVIPKIVVQDFSAEDGLIRYKTPEYDPTDTSKRRRRSSRASASVTPVDHHRAVTVQPPSFLSPALGAPPVGGLRPLYLAGGLKHRRSDFLVRDFLGFTGRRRMFGDVVAKDGSFVIAGL